MGITFKHVQKTFVTKQKFFFGSKKRIHALDDINLEIYDGEILGVVGESGSGKTTLARALLALTSIDAGSILSDDRDIHGASRREKKEIRKDFAVVFQDPASNLNPRHRVKSSIIRPLLIRGVKKAEAEKKAIEAMRKVKMDPRYLESFPHELSGGQQQRIAIARSLVLEPKIMILDEPTSALDISVQAQILNLLLDLQEELKLTYVLITHDLNVIRYLCDRIVVMYMGRIVELLTIDQLDRGAFHPYTQLLMASAPVLDPDKRQEQRDEVVAVSSQMEGQEGCNLAGRCLYEDGCSKEKPPLIEVEEGHYVACFHWEKIKNGGSTTV